MAVKVGINGFGRIGRNIYRTAIGDPDINFVAVNDLTDTRTLAHLLKYDSVLGNLDHEITATENGIKVENDEFRVFSQRDPTFTRLILYMLVYEFGVILRWHDVKPLVRLCVGDVSFVAVDNLPR